MKCSYIILEEGEEPIWENSSAKTFEVEHEDYRECAEKCANYDYNNHDGWESHSEWIGNGMTFRLFDDLTHKPIRDIKVKGEVEISFYAQDIQILHEEINNSKKGL